MKKINFLLCAFGLLSLLGGCQVKTERSGSENSDNVLKGAETSGEQKQKMFTGVEPSSEKMERPESVALEQTAPSVSPRGAKKPQLPDSLGKPLLEALQSQNVPEIIRTASAVLALYPKDIKALNALAMAHYRNGRHTMAKFFLNKAIKLSPEHSALHSNYALVLLAQGERREAMQAMKRALSIDPKDVVANANLGSMYAKERDFQKALPLLELAERSGISEPRILHNYGAALAVKGEHQKALELYRKVLDREPSSKETVLNLAILQVIHLNNMSGGRESLDRLKAMSPPAEWRNLIKDLENRVEVGLK